MGQDLTTKAPALERSYLLNLGMVKVISFPVLPPTACKGPEILLLEKPALATHLLIWWGPLGITPFLPLKACSPLALLRRISMLSHRVT